MARLYLSLGQTPDYQGTFPPDFRRFKIKFSGPIAWFGQWNPNSICCRLCIVLCVWRYFFSIFPLASLDVGYVIYQMYIAKYIFWIADCDVLRKYYLHFIKLRILEKLLWFVCLGLMFALFAYLYVFWIPKCLVFHKLHKEVVSIVNSP